MFQSILVALLLIKYSDSFSALFYKDYLCDLQDRMEKRCSQEVGVEGNVLGCARHCQNQESCMGFSRAKDTQMCYIHRPCTTDTSCTVFEFTHDFYSSYCVHGVWNDTTQSCVCRKGCNGNRCEDVVRSCDELATETGMTIGYIDPLQDGNAFKVRCFKFSNKRSMTIFRNSGEQSQFNRTYEEYENGFDIDEKNWWIGLRQWHILGNLGCNLLTTRLYFGSGGWVSRKHIKFVVDKKSNGYSFTYKSSKTSDDHTLRFNMSFGDCMSSVSNVPFSTWDSDNNDNGNDQNCASRVGSGWWHPPKCDLPCNLLGWGLNDWDTVPPHQRMAVEGVPMDDVYLHVKYISAKLECP